MYPYIHIFGHTIGTYGLCMVCGFFLAGFCAYRKGKNQGLKIEDLLIIAAIALAGALICGGALYIFITYPISEIIAFIQNGDFRFLTSGLVFYGGMIGGVFGALIGVRVARCNINVVERAVVPFIPLGHAIGRVGCVMAGCCHGFEYDGIFAIYYPNSVAGLPPEQGYFPVQPLESIMNIGICIILLYVEKKVKNTLQLLFMYMGLYAVMRFALEMLRGDAIRGQWNGLSTSQMISIAMLIACGVYAVILHIRKTRSRSAETE